MRDRAKLLAAQRRYDASPKRRAVSHRYALSEKGRANQCRYDASAKGREHARTKPARNAKRLWIGHEYYGVAATPELAAQIRAHVRARRAAFTAQQQELACP